MLRTYAMSEVDVRKALDPPREGMAVDTSVHIVEPTLYPDFSKIGKQLAGEDLSKENENGLEKVGRKQVP